MHCGESADDCVVSDLHMARDGSIVGKDHPVAHGAVVGDVTVCQKIPLVADFGGGTGRGSPVHRHKFPEGVAVANLQMGGFPRVLEILRLLADRTECVELIVSADFRRAHEGDLIL